jgi:hypothetical protein
MNASEFIYPRASYGGSGSPELREFDQQLQEFAQRVGYIAGLETGGKMTPEESYRALQSLWNNLSETSRSLGVKP